MSLINDALNRARELKPKPLSGLTPMSPVESQSRAGASWLLPMLGVLLLVAAGCLIGMALARRAGSTIENKPAPATAPVTNTPPVAAASPQAAVTNAIPVPLPQQPYRLQGVFADPVHPWAILNGKTVYPGSRVGDVVVKEISKNTLTLEAADGSRQQLVLPK